jgi:hypothetical protein
MAPATIAGMENHPTVTTRFQIGSSSCSEAGGAEASAPTLERRS